MLICELAAQVICMRNGKYGREEFIIIKCNRMILFTKIIWNAFKNSSIVSQRIPSLERQMKYGPIVLILQHITCWATES